MRIVSRVFNSLAIVAISTLFASGGFVTYLVAAGKLTAVRMERMAAVLRGDLDQIPASQPAGEAHAASQPASAPVHATADEIRRLRTQERISAALAERYSRDLDAKRELLEKAVANLISEQETFEKTRTEWKTAQDRMRQQNEDEGFRAEVDLVRKLPDAQAKEHVIATWKKHPADAVRLMKALGTSKSASVLKQFKTQEEVQIVHELLEQLRSQDVDKLTPAAGKRAERDASP